MENPGWKKINLSFSSQATPLSLQDLQEALSHYLTNLKQAQPSIEAGYETLQQEQRLWSDQYRSLHTSLRQAHYSLRTFCKLLENPTRLPEVALADRYPLLFKLQKAEEQMAALFPLLESATEPARTSKQGQRRRQEILHAFRRLLGNYEEVLSHGKSLSDRAYFHARQRSRPRRDLYIVRVNEPQGENEEELQQL